MKKGGGRREHEARREAERARRAAEQQDGAQRSERPRITKRSRYHSDNFSRVPQRSAAPSVGERSRAASRATRGQSINQDVFEDSDYADSIGPRGPDSDFGEPEIQSRWRTRSPRSYAGSRAAVSTPAHGPSSAKKLGRDFVMHRSSRRLGRLSSRRDSAVRSPDVPGWFAEGQRRTRDLEGGSMASSFRRARQIASARTPNQIRGNADRERQVRSARGRTADSSSQQRRSRADTRSEARSSRGRLPRYDSEQPPGPAAGSSRAHLGGGRAVGATRVASRGRYRSAGAAQFDAELASQASRGAGWDGYRDASRARKRSNGRSRNSAGTSGGGESGRRDWSNGRGSVASRGESGRDGSSRRERAGSLRRADGREGYLGGESGRGQQHGSVRFAPMAAQASVRSRRGGDAHDAVGSRRWRTQDEEDAAGRRGLEARATSTAMRDREYTQPVRQGDSGSTRRTSIEGGAGKRANDSAGATTRSDEDAAAVLAAEMDDAFSYGSGLDGHDVPMLLTDTPGGLTMTSRAADDDVDEMEQILDNVRVADANDAGDDDDASLSSSISSGNSDDDLRAKAKEKARKRAAAAHRELIDGVRDTQAGKMVHHAAKTLSTWTNLAGQRVGKLLALARGSKGKGWDLDELELSRIHALTRKLRNEGNRVLEILLSMEDDAREIETQLYDMERDFADGALSVDDESLIPELEAQLEEVEGEHSELDKYYQVLECLMTCVHGFLNLKGLPNTMNRIGQGAERNRVIAMLRAMGVDEIPGQLSGVIRGMRGKEIASVWGDSYAIVTAIQEMEKHVRALEEIGQLVDDDLLDELGAASTELTHEAYERATQRQLGSHPINADWYDDDEYADSYAGSLDEDDVEYDSQYADETYTEYTDDTPGYIQQLRDDARPLRTGLKWGRSRRAATTVASHPVDDVDDAVSELDGPTLGSSVGDVVHAVQKGGNRAQEERRSVLSESKSGGDEEREGEGEDEDGAIAALDDWASRGGRAFEAAASAAGADVDAAIDDTLDALSAGASASSSGRDGLVALPPPPPAAEDSSFDAYASTGALPATAMMSHPLDFDAASVSEVASRMSSFGPGEPRPSPRRSHSARQLHGIVTSHSLRSLRPDVSGPLDVGARATTDDGRADDDGDAAEAFPGFSPLVSPAFAGPQKTVRLSSPRLPPRPPTPDSTHATSAGTGLTSHDVSARLSTGSVTPRSTTGRTSAPSETPPDVGARQAGSEVVESVASARGASLPATPRDHTAVSIAVVSSAASGSEMEFFEPLVTPGRELLKQMLPGQSPDDAKPSSPLGSHVERKSDAAEVASAPDLDAAGIAVEVVEASLAEAEPVGQEPEPRTPRMDEAGGDVATGGGVSPLTGRLKERMDSVRANTEKRSALAAKRIEALRSRVPPDRASQELAEGPVGSTAASATRRSRSSTPLRSPSGKYSVGRASLTGHPLDGSEVDRASTRSSLAPTPLRIQFGGSSSRESSDGDGDGDDAASRDGSAVELTLLPAEGEDASAAVGSISLVARSRGSSDPAKSLSFQNTPTPLPGVEEGSVHAPSPDTSADVAAAVATPAPAAARAVPDAEAAGGGAAKAGKKGGCFGGCC